MTVDSCQNILKLDFLQVKVTEIFDVSENESPVLQTPQEIDANKHLEFDDRWDDFSATGRIHNDDSKLVVSFKNQRKEERTIYNQTFM